MEFSIVEVQLHDRKEFWVLDRRYKKIKAFSNRSECENFIDGSCRGYYLAELIKETHAEDNKQAGGALY